MPLEKLIDMLSTGHLFFSPLSFFVKTDPFEGYLPAVAIEADAQLFKHFNDDIESCISALEEFCKSERNALSSEASRSLREKLQDAKSAQKLAFQAITQCIAVNCWHANEGESEAMWRLYSDNGKAIAIETTVGALKDSILSKESEHRVHIYPVKYLDFFDKELKPIDCVVKGHRAPLLKRRSYQHENEVRVFIGRTVSDPRDAGKIEYWQPAAIRLPVDVKVLVKQVHISPYSGEPFVSAVIRICELLGLGKETAKQSRLLTGHEELLKPLML